ncbi:MAG: ABC transporter ATP-binding protein [Coriobacteriia bacterium]
MPEALLEVEGLVTGYGHVKVLDGVSLEVRQGETVTVIGSNGAGKTTLLRCLAGLLPAWEGDVRFDGASLVGVEPHKRVAGGLVLVPEGRSLFGPLSVEENLRLGAYGRRDGGVERDKAMVLDLFPVLRERLQQSAATLSGGEQQMLAIARALMSGPRLLLLDEPSLGLAPLVIRDIFSVLERLREEGMTILLIEQDASMALKHSDRGYVMRTGEVVLSGASADLAKNDEVRLAYLGAWAQTEEGRAQ